MAIRNIVFSDEAQIRKKSRPVVDFDEKLWELLDDMRDTMRKNDGVGIAAPQVGILKRIVVIEANGQFLELINPEIIKQSGKQESIEGCLSVKDYNGLVIRPEKVLVKAYNRMGETFTMGVEGFMSTVFSHEIDHLDGILFIDKAVELYDKKEMEKMMRKEKKEK